MSLILLKVGMNHEDPVGCVLREAKRRKLSVLKQHPDHGVLTNDGLEDFPSPNAVSLFRDHKNKIKSQQKQRQLGMHEGKWVR